MGESKAQSNPKVVADLYRAGDESHILALNRMQYGPTDILTTLEDFNWRYAQNPVGQAIISVIRDCSSDSVVGFIWIVPVRIRIRGQGRLAAIGTDLVIHPEYRNGLSYIKLMRRFQQAFKEYDIPLHFSFLSEEAYRRQGEKDPRTVSMIPLLVKLLDLAGLFHTHYAKRWQHPIAASAGWLVSLLFSRQCQVASGGEVTVQAVDQFDQSFDEFWSEVRDKYPIMVERDRAFLSWRFAQVSGRRYHVLEARAGHRVLGYAVLRCSTVRGVRSGLVLDLLVSDSSLSETAGVCLLAEAEAYFRAQKVALIVGLMVPFAAEYQIFCRAGYHSLPAFLAPKSFRLGFFLHNTSDRDLISLSAQDWFITMADHESF
jgi:hypothetical protein